MESLRDTTKFVRNKLRRSHVRSSSTANIVSHLADEKCDRSFSCERIDQTSLGEDFFMKQAASSVDNIHQLQNDTAAATESMMMTSSNSINALTSSSAKTPHRRSTVSGKGHQVVQATRISCWAVSFDNLLRDPLGVLYFREFLKLEFSEENLLFYEACEKLKEVAADDHQLLKTTSQDIFDTFLDSRAPQAVNITNDDQQSAHDAMQHNQPTPDMFHKQQQGVYNLMRMDSYRRFVKSDLYRKCLYCEIESRPLPLDVQQSFNNPTGGEASHKPISRTASCDSDHRRARKKESFKSFFSMKKQRGGSQKISSFEDDDVESNSSGEQLENKLKDMAAVQDLLSVGASNTNLAATAATFNHHPTTTEQAERDGDAPHRPTTTCHVTLWDGNTTLVGATSGDQSLRDAVERVAARRRKRFGAAQGKIDDVDAYDVTGDDDVASRRKLDWKTPMTSLAGRRILLESRSSFRINFLPEKSSLGITARCNKPVRKAVELVLRQYKLLIDDVSVNIENESRVLDLNEPVSNVDGKVLVVDYKPVAPRTKAMSLPRERIQRSLTTSIAPSSGQHAPKSSRRVQTLRRETDELFSIVSSMQRHRMDDQCGLISQQDLQLPDFLRLDDPNPNLNTNNNRSTISDDFIRDVATPPRHHVDDDDDVDMADFTPPPPLRCPPHRHDDGDDADT